MASRTTPLRAIRAFCKWCCGGQAGEVRQCVSIDCPLWPFRFGRDPGRRISPAQRAAGKRLNKVK